MTGATEIKLKDCPKTGYTTTIVKRGAGTCGVDFTMLLIIENISGNRIFLDEKDMKYLLKLSKKHFGE